MTLNSLSFETGRMPLGFSRAETANPSRALIIIPPKPECVTW